MLSEYMKIYPYSHPARMAVRRAAVAMRALAKKYFGGRMLDIGCGSKHKASIIGEFVDDYVGLDHEGSIHDQSVVDIFGTADNIPEPDNSYDCVLCTSVLEHLEEPARALRESLRVLKPGGHALYTVPLFWHIHEAPRDFFRYTRHGLEYLFTQAGYEIVELNATSGFWMTFGCEAGYYAQVIAPRWAGPVVRVLIALGNFLFPILDDIDRRLNPRWDLWTWSYQVVARKPR